MSLIDIALMAVIIAGAVYLLCRSMCKKKGHCPGCDSGMCKTKGEKNIFSDGDIKNGDIKRYC